MSDVPSEISREILLRLPAESLLPLRSVCKEWLGIIDDPSFIRAHTNNQVYSHTILLRNELGDPLYSFSLDSLNFINGHQMIDATRIKQLFRCGVPLLPQVFASCDGLILVYNSKIKKVWELAIWNPLTMEFHELPKSKPDFKLFGFGVGIGIGFGYDYEADDYKVVTTGVSVVYPVYPTLIYSLKSDSWRRIEDCPCPVRGHGSFLNGTLYWEYRGMIIALDLGTERYSHLPLPPVQIGSNNHLCLDVLDGCLICSLGYRGYLFEGWVMKDNGVEKSWIKLFSLQHSLHKLSGELWLVAYLKGKEQVVLQHDWGFLWFDIRNNSVKKFSIHGLPDITSSQICLGSLVRLSGRAIQLGAVSPNGHGIELGAVRTRRALTRKRKRDTKRTDTDTRLKFCVSNARKSKLGRKQCMLQSRPQDSL